MIKQKHSNEARLRRHRRVRKKVTGTSARPRLSVFRSGTDIYAQIIDDEQHMTLVAASSRDPELRALASLQPEGDTKHKGRAKTAAKDEAKDGAAETAAATAAAGEESQPTGLAGLESNRRVVQARMVGKLVAQRAKGRGIVKVVFDRGGYLYHGRVAALATGAREGGLEF